MQERLGVGAQILSATMTERIEAMRDVLGSRETVVTGPMGERVDAMGATWHGIRSGTGLADDWHLARAALADLRLPGLPAAPSPSSLRSRVTRLNPLSLGQLGYGPARAACRRQTRGAVARLELWPLNPVTLGWNLVRAIRQSLGFLVAMHGERY
jgi:hypothetical protein